MTATVVYLRQKQLSKLKTAVKDNLDAYSLRSPDWHAFFNGEEYERFSTIKMAEDLPAQIRMPNDNNTMDAENCIIVYKSLRNLSPQQAADERVWAHFTHFGLREYVQRRWPLDKNDAKKKEQSVLAHYFASGARGLFRDNAVSRLWWMGRIADRCPYFSINKTLEILLYQADVRANLLERSSFGMSAEIFSAVIKWLEKSYNRNKLLFERNTFRDFMKHLNRKGGRVVLNALDENQLDKLISHILEADLGLNLNKL